MSFSFFNITARKFLIPLLMPWLFLFSGISFAEDEETVDTPETEEVLEQQNDAEEPVENQEAVEAQNTESEEAYEREEPTPSNSDGMDEQEREHAQKIEDLEAAYAREQAEKNSEENNQQFNENSVRTKRNKSLKELDRARREGHRNKRERSSSRYNDAQAKQPSNTLPSNSGKSTYVSEKKLDIDSENFVCDPVISVQAQNRMRFDILKDLADEHGFEITILESENKLMSIEKNQPLTKVIESITRDMSVVLNFKKMKDCNRLVEIAVLDNNEWGGSGGGYEGASGGRFISNRSGGDESEKAQRYKPQFKAPKLVEVDPMDSPSYEQLEERRIRREERKAQRLENENVRSLNDELPNGDQLKAQYNVKGDNWKKDINETRVEIPDMEEYVQQVLDGERQPDLRNMSLKQRSEYMKLRRELRSKQAE